MKQEHEMTPGVLVSDDMSAGDYKARCAVLEAELVELRKRACVPEGYRVVPVEPTEAMIRSAMQYDSVQDPKDDPSMAEQIKLDWALMLDAAPAPVEQEGQEPAAWIRFRSDGCYEGPHRSIDDVRKRSGEWTPLYPASAPVEPSAVKDSLTAQPAAYAVFAENGNIRIWCADPVQAETLRAEYGHDLQPLYTTPQPAPAAAQVTPEECPRTDELHRLDKQCRDDVARSMGMTPVGDGYPWSGLLAEIKSMAARPAAQDVAGRTDTERLDFILQKARKVTAENVLTIDGWEISVYVEEGAMGDVRYPEIQFAGKWETGSPEVLAVQRQAIDAAMPAHQSGGVK